VNYATLNAVINGTILDIYPQQNINGNGMEIMEIKKAHRYFNVMFVIKYSKQTQDCGNIPKNVGKLL
tara:strand:- start:558 stop:758 length:201 start_codon:yes stop_codon:yes gene_type:complete